MKKGFVFAFILAVAAGCGGGDDNTSNGSSQETVVPTNPVTGEKSTVIDAMNTAIQGEFLAEETYMQVVQDFGAVQPFASIITAEVKHSDALAALFVARGLEVPESVWNADNVPRYPSVQEACDAGVTLETATVARYDAWLAGDLPADVARVFTSLRDASRDKHLPAFERCVENVATGQ